MKASDARYSCFLVHLESATIVVHGTRMLQIYIQRAPGCLRQAGAQRMLAIEVTMMVVRVCRKASAHARSYLQVGTAFGACFLTNPDLVVGLHS